MPDASGEKGRPMSLEALATPRALTLGVELELQIVDRNDDDLTAASGDLHRVLRDELLASFERVAAHAAALKAEQALVILRQEVQGQGNDAVWLRRTEAAGHPLPDLVRQAARRWHGET